MGASVRAINGGIECDSGPIAAQRVQLIQCFQRQFNTQVDTNTACPARAVGDTQSDFVGTETQSQQQSQELPSSFVIALVVLGTITLVLGVVVVVIMVILGKRMRSQERV